jgi:mono/diheme cytochrome c family protein
MRNRLKTLAGLLLALPLIAIMSPARAAAVGEDVAATYKTKCAACHGAKSEKSFDPTKADGVLVDGVLKGIKPKMPSYDGKLTAEQAKDLVVYMKSLRSE